MDAIARFAEHAVSTTWDDLPTAAVAAAKVFILDSIGVGIAGSANPWAAELVALQETWGRGAEARVWAHGNTLPAPSAAFCNGFQMHCNEYDCVHEGAVIHPMTVVFPSALAYAERSRACAAPVPGRDLLEAVILGVDVACGIGIASTSGLTFFRPATAGALGACAAIGRLRGFDRDTAVSAMGIAYSMLSGTLQAHIEGSPVLPMQIGVNARNAVMACDMAARGISGPRDVLEGRYGYYALFEGGHDLPSVLADLGRRWRITEVGHKPYPAGRATHGIIEAIQALRGADNFAAGDVVKLTARVPPVIHQLVSRPAHVGMSANYARLCTGYVAARTLLNGALSLDDYRPSALSDPATLELAQRIDVVLEPNPDPNALVPISVAIELAGGRRCDIDLPTVYGHPDKPMSRDAHLDKFRRNWIAGANFLPAQNADRLIDMVENLQGENDAAALVDPVVPT